MGLRIQEPQPNEKGQRSGFVLSDFSAFSKMKVTGFLPQTNKNQP